MKQIIFKLKKMRKIEWCEDEQMMENIARQL